MGEYALDIFLDIGPAADAAVTATLANSLSEASPRSAASNRLRRVFAEEFWLACAAATAALRRFSPMPAERTASSSPYLGTTWTVHEGRPVLLMSDVDANRTTIPSSASPRSIAKHTHSLRGAEAQPAILAPL